MEQAGQRNRFCTHCGALLPEEARFCGSCGAPVAAPARTPKKKRRFWWIAAAALVLAAAVGLAVALSDSGSGGGGGSSGGRGYKDVALAYEEAEFAADGEKIADLLHDKVIENYARKKGLTVSEAKARIADMFHDETAYVASIYEEFPMSFKFLYAEDYDEEDFADYQRIYEEYGFHITEAKLCTVEITFIRNGTAITYETHVSVMKAGGKWYLEWRGMTHYFSVQRELAGI